MIQHRKTKATSKWRDATIENPAVSGTYLTIWATGSAKWQEGCQWYNANDHAWERVTPDFWARINKPMNGR